MIGAGRDEKQLRRMAGKNVGFSADAPDDEMREHGAMPRADIPWRGRFRVTPVEAQAVGVP